MQTRRSVRPVQALAGVLLAAALALTGCSADDSGGSSADSVSRSDADAKGAAPGSQEDGAGAADSSRSGGAKATAPPKVTASHIIRTASLTVRVKDVPDALDDARTTAENAGGFVGDETTTRDGQGRERTRMILRVPTDRYEEVLTELEGSGKLLERTAKAQDVTDQVVDVDSRIKTQRASVARIRELMDQATKLADVVTLEGELSSRQADLESLLTQQASLKDRTSLATITLSLSETAVKKAAKDEDPGFVDALSGGWHAFVTMLRWIAMALGAVLPFAAGAALLAVLWLRFVRPRTAARRPAPATAAGTGPRTTGTDPGAGALPVAPPARKREARGEQEVRGEQEARGEQD
ncbi:DUF4349 domain-containing protein [Streptomyces sp. NPDC058371]|uniref:DUF4349 domain-containing protein n=1 Tax=Streptomyces sp. NPDC058371 TaxID=3346463 RepID=UPI00364FD352